MSTIYGHAFDNHLSNKNQEVITEVCIGTSKNMCAYVYQQETRGLKGDPENAYIEIYNNEKKMKADKMIRIVIGLPYYRDHRGQQDLWKMTSKEKKQMNEFLNSQSNSEKYKGKTVYQAALDFYKIDPKLPVTDYSNMTLEPSSNRKQKDKDSKKI